MERRNYEPIIDAVKEAIDIHVNGKIDKMTKRLEEHIQEDREWKKGVTEKLDELKPVRDGLVTLNNLKKFAVWLGIPLIALASYLLAKFK